MINMALLINMGKSHSVPIIFPNYNFGPCDLIQTNQPDPITKTKQTNPSTNNQAQPFLPLAQPPLAH